MQMRRDEMGLMLLPGSGSGATKAEGDGMITGMGDEEGRRKKEGERAKEDVR